MADTTFENKFAQLVESQINDKLPSLMPYRVGFQLLDKADDDTRAVGVTAFVVNGLWIYVPIFFLKGSIKGLDEMWVKQKDLFVPAMDNWIASLKEQGVKAFALGNVSTKYHDPQSNAPEDVSLDEQLFGIAGKQAACNQLMTLEEFEKLAHSDWDWNLSLDRVLPCMPKEALEAFANSIRTDSDFANALLSVYQPSELGVLCGLMKTAAEEEQVTPTSQVSVIDKMDHPDASTLTESEKKLFTQNGVFVKDKRTEHSILFRNQVSSQALQTPTSSGFYDVLMNDGSLKSFIVLMPSCKKASECDGPFLSREKPYRYPERNDSQALLIPMENPTEFLSVSSIKLLAQPAHNLDSFSSKKGKIGYIASLRSAQKGKDCNRAIFVQHAETVIPVEFDVDYTAKERSLIPTKAYLPSKGQHVNVEYTSQPGKLSVHGSTLLVPEDTRLFFEMPYRKSSEFRFGDLGSIQRMLLKEANVGMLKVVPHRNTVSIHSRHGNQSGIDKVAALRHLTEVEGVFGGQAQQMLKEAERHPSSGIEYFIKYAAPYDSMSSSDFMSRQSSRKENGAKETFTRKRSRPMMPQEATAMAVEASKTGNRQVLDVAVLKGLIETADVSELRKDFLVGLMKGMDKAGRLLFIFYWHNEQFEERYGKENLAKLEDKIRQVFKTTGDLILFLKEKLATLPDMPENLFGTLSEDIGEL